MSEKKTLDKEGLESLISLILEEFADLKRALRGEIKGEGDKNE